MKTKFLAAAIFVLILCCMTCVSAADDNATEIALEETMDDSNIELSMEDTNILSDGDKKDAEINVTVPEMKAGEQYQFDVSMPKDADAWIDVYYDDEDSYFTDTYISGGVGTFDFIPGGLGNHTLRLHYYGNDVYNEIKYYEIPFEIRDYTLVLNEKIVEWEKTVELHMTHPSSFNCTVDVTVNGNGKYEAEKEYGYWLEIRGDDLKLGNNSVNLYFAGDERFHEFNETYTLEVFNRSTVKISVECPEMIIAPQGATFNITLSENITTTLSPYIMRYWDYDEYDWEDIYPEIEIINGKGTFTRYFGSIGTYRYRISYGGDETYKPAHADFDVEVKNYTIIMNDLEYSQGESVLLFDAPNGFYNELNVTVDGVSYIVERNYDDEDYYGYYVLRLDSLSYGNHSINIYYGGDEKFHELNITRNVYLDSQIEIEKIEMVWKDDNIVSLVLPSDAVGKLVVYDANASNVIASADLENGIAEINLNNFEVGFNEIQVKYENGNYTVEALNTTVEVYPIMSYSNFVLNGYDGLVRVNANNGNFTVYRVKYEDGNKVLTEIGFANVSGETEITLSGLEDGYNNILMVYQNADYEHDYEEYINVEDIYVDIYGSLPKSTKKVAARAVNDEIYPDVYLDGNRKGVYDLSCWDDTFITFEDGELTVGEHALEFRVGEQNKTFKFTVFDSNITLPDYVFKGEDCNLTVQLPSEFNGTLTVYLGEYDDYDKYCSVDLVDGQATVPINDLDYSKWVKLVYDDGKVKFEDYRKIWVYDVEITIKDNSIVESDAQDFEFNIHHSDIDVNYYFDGNFKNTYYSEYYGNTVSFDDGDLSNGNHTIEISFDVDGFLVSKKVGFNVLDVNVTIPRYALKGGDSFITFQIDEEYAGNVTAYCKSNNYDEYELFGFASIVKGEANISLADLNTEINYIKLVYDNGQFNFTKYGEVNVLDVQFSIKNNSVVKNDVSGFDVYFNSYYNGDLTFKFDDEEKYNSSVYSYSEYISLYDCNMSDGRHTIEVILSWDDGSLSKKIEFNTASVIITIPEKIAKNYNTPVPTDAFVDLNYDAEGNVTCFVDGRQYYFRDVWGGSVYISLMNLDVGIHDVEIIYSGDDKYPKTTKSGKVNVQYVARIINDYIVYGVDDLLFIVPSTENLIVKIDGNETEYAVGADNVITVSRDNLDIGSHRLTVENGSETLLKGSFDVVGRIKYDYGSDVVSLILPEDANGTLVVEVYKYNSTTGDYDKVTSIETPISDGKAVCELDLIPDDYQIRASYADGNYDVSDEIFDDYDPVSVKIDKSKIYVNESATISVKAKEDSGEIRITMYKNGNFVNEKILQIKDNEANLALSNLESGKYTFESNYGYSWIPMISLEVIKYDVDLTIEIEDISKGETAFANITLPSDAKGKVDVLVDGKQFVCVNANATLSIPLDDLTVGAHVVEFKYSGDDKYLENSSYKAFIVKDVKLESSINATCCEIIEGETAIIEVNVTEGATGLILVDIEGSKYYGELAGGVCEVKIRNLEAGNYEATVRYAGDDKYLNSSTTVSVKVNEKADSIIVINDPAFAIGESATFTATVNGEAADVVYFINGVIGDTISSVEATTYVVTVYFAGNATHYENLTNVEYTVSKAISEIKSVTVEPVIEGAVSTIEVTMNSAESGFVIIEIDGVNYTASINGSKAYLSVVLDETVSGMVYYLGDDKFAAATPKEFSAVVNPKADSVIVINDPAFAIGESAKFTATVNGEAADVIYLINGVETDTIANVEATTYTVTAIFAGNATNKANRTTETYTVSKYASAIKEVSVEPVIEGAVSTIEVTMNATESGSVIIEINGVNYTASINGSKASLNVALNETASGKVYYLGDDKFAAAEAKEFTATVNDKADSVIAINGPALTIGESATFTATVNGAAADVVYLINGVVGDTVSSVEATTYVVTVLFAGNATHEENVTTKVFTVNKNQANVNVIGTDVVEGQASTITVEVTENATGIVIVNVNGTEYAIDLYKEKSISIVLNEPGTYDLSAKYLGDDKFEEASATGTPIKVAERQTSEVDITIPDIKAGEDSAVEISIPNATGEVTVIVDGKKTTVPLNENGSAKVPIENATSGNHSVVVIYNGDDTHDAAVETKTFEVPEEVVPPKEKTAPVINVPENIKVGDSPVVDISVSNATGNVSVIVDGVETVLQLVNGSVKVTIENVSAGNHGIVAIYHGDEAHEATYNASSFKVPEVPVIVQKASEFSEITINDDNTISVVLKDGDGKAIENALISYSVNGKVNTAQTDKDGKFVIVGENGDVIEISYAGNEYVVGTNTTLKLNYPVPPVVVKVESHFDIKNRAITINGYAVDTKAGEEGIYYATTLLDANGKPISNKYIEFAVNNKIYNRTTYENGSFEPYKLNMIRAGRYTMAFNFGGDDNYTNAFACVCVDLDKKPITITAKGKAYKSSVKNKMFTATLSTIVGSSHDGKAHLRSGLLVTLTVNGKTYFGTTDSKGMVTFKITGLSKKAKYIAVISYEGDKTYESATKSVTLRVK